MHDCTDALAAAHSAARRFKRAHARAECARVERDAIVARAYANGATLPAIAATTGMSVSRVFQIVTTAQEGVSA